MINKDVIMKMLGQMPDEDLIKGFSTMIAGSAGGGNGLGMDGDGSELAAFGADGADDPENSVKGWNDIMIEQGEDNRPAIADKSFLVSKQDKLNKILGKKAAMGGSMMPHDDASGAYDGFGNGSF